MFMRFSNKPLLLTVFVILFGVGIVVYVTTARTPYNQAEANQISTGALRAFVETTNQASGIQSEAAFNYILVGEGNPTNFGIVRCRDEVRCDTVVQKRVVKFQQSNQPSPDLAEIDKDTNAVVSLHRAVPSFVGVENYPVKEIERIAREFLQKVYPEFSTIEPTLTFNLGTKGTRLNNDNYFFRWNDERYIAPDGLQVEVQPFIQVGITASGFIYSYDNTVELSRNLTP